ncbi:MAG TPA: TonB-dependent receptor [Bryobacteraceae bacterium]|nr:TonB-dependent receptor [Bryobacteraceae bacterium]
MCCRFLLPAQTPAQEQKPEPVRTTVTVVEQIAAETPANMSVLDSDTLSQIPGANLDDRLREIPGFTLFRRSSSLVANPTTQGISLRGIGSSGASRTLVLWDSIPANDPFGGWVYWTQFVPDEMNRVEITRGSSTSAFGDRAMSGAMGLFSRAPEKLHLLAGYEYGNEDTHDLTAGLSQVWRRAAISGVARAFTTDGYFIVPQNIRGPVDTPANVEFVTGDVHIDGYTSLGNFFLKTNILAEERKNGTLLTHNSTGMGTVSLRYVRDFTSDALSLSGFYTSEGFHSTFDSVNAARTVDTLSYTQTVPNNALGATALWQHHAKTWNLLGGADVYRAEGTDTDHLVPSGLRVGGGTQLQHGIYTQADAALGPVHLFAGARDTFVSDTQFFAPTGGFVIGKKRLRARGSAYRSFRAPTLNELFRQFKTGNTTTLANADLVPETLWGAEAGFDWVGETSMFRVTGYRNEMNNLITNVTLSSSPTAIVRQRQNAAAALSRGFEATFNQRFHNFTGELRYLFVDSRYVTGYRISQVPKHQGTGQIMWQREGTLLAGGVRIFDYQFDDDLNQFRLPGFTTFYFLGRQHIVRSLSAQFTLENAFDRVFYTAFSPTPNTGSPRLWRIGLRWDGHL